MNKFCYINTFSIGCHHEMINTCLLEMCCNITDSIDYYGCKSSIDTVLSGTEVGSCKLKRHELWLPQKANKIATAFRYIIGALYNIYILLRIPSKSTLFFSFNNVIFLNILSFLQRKKKHTVFICCHGELELLLPQKGGIGFFAAFLRMNAKLFFLKKNRYLDSKLNFIVLGDVILENLKILLPEQLHDRFFSVDHPYHFEDVRYTKGAERDFYNIGTVGVMSRSKGGDDLSYIAQHVDIDKYHLSVIGSVESEYLKPFADLGIKMHHSYIPRTQFESEVRELDFILFLYPIDSYKMIASVAVFDAIRLKKPIIAIKNDYFTYLFRKYGPFGYLVDSKEDIVGVIEMIPLLNTDFSDSFNILRGSLSPQRLISEFQQKVDKCFC